MEWKIDLTEAFGLRNWYRKQPGRMRVASAMLLNEFAYGTRQSAVAHIGRVMTVRNAGFVGRQIRYTKTSTSLPINSQRSSTGSVAKERFTGWVEQEKGTPTERHRFATLAGRGGSKTKVIRPSVRLKRANEVITIKDYMPKGGLSNYGGFIAMLLRRKENRLVRIKGSIFKRGKQALAGPTRSGRGLNRKAMELVQNLKTKQPKQLHWLRQARAIYFRKHQPQATWNKVVDRLMRPPSKR